MSPGLARDAAMRKAFYELAVANPGAVAWCCGLKLEQAVALIAQFLTQQVQSDSVPGLGAVRSNLEARLRQELGADATLDDLPDLVHMGMVDDYYGSFEWSAGGMVHLHLALWIFGFPRIDRVQVPRERLDGSVELHADREADMIYPQTEAANIMACLLL